MDNYLKENLQQNKLYIAIEAKFKTELINSKQEKNVSNLQQ